MFFSMFILLTFICLPYCLHLIFASLPSPLSYSLPHISSLHSPPPLLSTLLSDLQCAASLLMPRAFCLFQEGEGERGREKESERGAVSVSVYHTLTDTSSVTLNSLQPQQPKGTQGHRDQKPELRQPEKRSSDPQCIRYGKAFVVCAIFPIVIRITLGLIILLK